MSVFPVANTASRRTWDFDQHTPQYKQGWARIAADLHASGPPIAWTDAHDGYWVVASIPAIHEVANNWELFTAVNDLDGTENGGKGQGIPRYPYRFQLGESDPPLHTGRRRLEAPFFAPKALRNWRPAFKKHLDEALNSVIEQGEADLIDDILIPATARTTLFVLGYNADDWEDAADAAHKGTIHLPTDSDYPYEQMARLRVRFREMLAERAANPTGDVISSIAQGMENGEPLSVDVGESMMNALVFGGFDTTVSSAAFGLLYMDAQRDAAQRMIVEEAFRANAVEELLRFHVPAQGIARTALADTELLGQEIKKGERVWMWLAGANRDPQVFADPDTIQLERPNAREHVTFSAGPHRCLGSPLAKIELQEIYKTVPTRLANLEFDRDRLETYPNVGGVNSWVHIPITFTPGAPRPAHAE
jgi:cytochrome P450